MSKLEDETHLDQTICLKKPLIPFRYFILFMVLAATTVLSAVRNTINVAIIAMVDDSQDNSTQLINGTDHHSLQAQTTFNWNQHEQGIILGSYWYTYTAVQIFGGNLSDRFNVVHMLSITQVVVTLCTFVTPIAVTYSLYAMIATRMAMGLVQGITFPCLYNMIENWFPPTELGLAQGMAAAGCDLGSALTSIFTAWISARGIFGGWPAAFYAMGLFNLTFTVLWITMVTRDPFSNSLVSDYEKRQLYRIVLNKKIKQPKLRSTPWVKLLTSLPLWSIIITKGSIGLAVAVLSSKIPVYLDSVLGYKLENNGLINGLLYVGSASTQLTCGPLSKFIIARGWLSRTATRKWFETIAFSGIIINLVAVSYLGTNGNLIVGCLVLSMFFYGTNLGGDVPIVAEMAPDLIGTTYGFANTVASASGFIAPAMIAFILGDDAGSESRWSLAFQIVAGIQLAALIIFVTFASAEPQPWGKNEEPDDETSTQLPPQTDVPEVIYTN